MRTCKRRVASTCSVLMLLLAYTCAIAGGPAVFQIPDANPPNGLYRPDIQSSYPQVNWQALDVLCIPAGHYKFIRIGNLPERSAANPLTITNCGGQLRVGGLNHHYLFVLSGGTHWRLTGQYSALDATGDANYTGHAHGRYAHSQGRYGILIDDETIEEGNPSGLAVGGGASDFEIDFIEIRRVGFAGMLLKTDNDGAATMRNVRIHDVYIHDTGSEGVYMGSTQSQPQHTIEGLSFYNNRVVRSGTEIFQLGQIGEGSEVHNNVFFLGALDWKNPFQNFQNNATQLAPRTGSFSFHHNIVIGAAASWINFLGIDVASDPHPPEALVEIADNYYSHSRHFGAYVARMTQPGMRVRFARNQFSRINFQLDELDPEASNFNQFFRLGSGGVANTRPIEFIDNQYDGSQFFIGNWANPNQTVGTVSGQGNVAMTIPAPAFVDSGYEHDFDYLRVEIWTDVDFNSAPVSYESGDIVSVNGVFFQCQPAGGCAPGLHPASNSGIWTALPDPADDLRLRVDSVVQGVGLLDSGELIFFYGFDG